MKIAQITYSGFGGLGSVVFSLINADLDHEHDWIVGFIGDQPLDDDYRKLCNEMELSHGFFKLKPNKPVGAWIKLYKWLRSQKPDAVICHTLNPILACRVFTWIFKIPLIAVEHTSNSVKPRNQKITSFLAMFLADKIVLLTELYRKELKSQYGVFFQQKKVCIIQNGIDLKVFHPKHGRPVMNNFKIGMAARFTVTKKQEFLIYVLEKIYQLSPNIDLKLSFAGNGSEFDRVQEVAKNSTISSKIIFEGLMDEKSIAPWLRDLNIYVHASDGETLSTSILQSMGCGIPIIASDVSGINNLLGRGTDLGYCIINDCEIFASTILKLLIDSDEQIRISQNVRRHAELYCGNNYMLHKYINLIRSII